MSKSTSKKRQEKLLVVIIVLVLVYALVYAWKNKAGADLRTGPSTQSTTCYNNGTLYIVPGIYNCSPDIVFKTPIDSTGKTGPLTYTAKVGSQVQFSVNFWDNKALYTVALYEGRDKILVQAKPYTKTKTLDYTWNTAGKARGIYTIKAYARDVDQSQKTRYVTVTLQ